MKKNLFKRATAFASALTITVMSLTSGGVFKGISDLFSSPVSAYEAQVPAEASGEYKDISSWDQLKTHLASNTSSETQKIRLTEEIHPIKSTQINGNRGESLTIKESSSCEIDLNGYDIYRESFDGIDEGNVIIVKEGATLTIRDSSDSQSGKIRGGLSEYGGGIINYGTLYIINAAVDGNAAVATKDGGGCGGGIANYGDLHLIGAKIRNNYAIGYKSNSDSDKQEGNGGGIFNCGRLFAYTGTEISGNYATDNGGGIYTGEGSAYEITPVTDSSTGVMISDNHAEKYGGGIYSFTSGIIADSEISRNKALRGGGIYHDKGSLSSDILQISGATTIINNAASEKGGGVYQGAVISVCDSLKVHGNNGSNYYLSGQETIKTGKLNNDTNISVTAEYTETQPRAITKGFKENNPGISEYYDYSKLFFADSAFVIGDMLYSPTETKGEIKLLPHGVLYVDRSWNNDLNMVIDHVVFANQNLIRDISTAKDTNRLESGYYYVLTSDTVFDNRLVIDRSVKIILNKDHKLTCNKGIQVGEDATLNIYAGFDSDGKLEAKVTNSDNAAIGGSKWEKAGQINIYGGTIDALSISGNGAAIGGGLGMQSDTKTGSPKGISIYGGKVTAEENNASPAIGGGRYGRSSWENGIKIYGGEVKAYGSVGIGDTAVSYDASTPSIDIYGGQIIAQGWGGAGIGSADCSNGEINIHGGIVKADTKHATRCAAAIGSGRDHDQSGDINISGGIVLASSLSGAGIGAGIDGSAGNIRITGGTVDARSSAGGAGIGGGKNGNGGNIYISGNASVFAMSCLYDDSWSTTHEWAGYGNVTPQAPYGINVGGKAFAVLIAFIYDAVRDSNYSGAGIGGGFNGNGNTVTIRGDKARVIAIASDEEACAIGWGDEGSSSGTVNIYDRAKVSAGSTMDSAKPQPTKKRESSCTDNRYVCIEPCNHSSCKWVCMNSQFHYYGCDNCGQQVELSPHKYPTSQPDAVCEICGCTATPSTVTIVQKDHNGSEVKEVIDNIQKNSEFTVPQCTSAPDDHEFVCWVDESNTPLLPGDKFTVNNNTITAVYLRSVRTEYIDENGKTASVKARQLTDDIVCLTNGIYVADSAIEMQIGYPLLIKGNVEIILADEGSLSIPASYEDHDRSIVIDQSIKGTLSVYGQQHQTGKLITDGRVEITGFHQYGGKVEQNTASSGIEISDECVIKRGDFTAEALMCTNEPITIKGGNVHIKTYRLNDKSSMVLGWTKSTDSIKIDSMYPDNIITPTISVEDKKAFKDENDNKYSGKLSSVEISAIIGQTLTPDCKDAEIYGYALGLGDGITIKIYYSVYDPDLVEKNNGQVGISSPGRTEEKYQFAETEDIDGIEYYIFRYDVAAKEMKDTVTIQLYENGTAVYDPNLTSVRQIIDMYKSRPAEYSREIPLLNAMLHYGEYSQKYFEYNCEGLDYTDISDTVIDDEYSYDGQPAASLPEGTTFAGATLSLRSKTTLSFYFKTNDKSLTFALDDAAKQKGYECVTETDTYKGYTIFRVRGIAANDLGKSITVSVNDTYSVTYCPMNYCYTALNGGTTDEDLKNVCRALYLYYIEDCKYSPY